MPNSILLNLSHGPGSVFPARMWLPSEFPAQGTLHVLCGCKWFDTKPLDPTVRAADEFCDGRCWVRSIDRELCWKHPWVMLPDCLLSLFYELHVSTQWVAQLQTMTPPRALLLVWLLGDGSFEFRFPPPKLSKTSHSRFYTSSLCVATRRHSSGLLPLSHVLQHTG